MKIKFAVFLFSSLFLIIYLFLFPHYSYKTVKIDGKEKTVIIPKNQIAKIIGMRKFEDIERNFDGMLFLVDKNTPFTTKNMKSYTLICSLKKEQKEFKTVKCKCLPPEVLKYHPDSNYVYEEVYKNKNCQ